MDRGETKQSLVSPLLLSIENLTKFETEESVQVPSNFPHVISVLESERIACSFKVKEDNFSAGDIVLWDGEKKVVADPNGFSMPVSGYTPIGTIVIPANHMDDGQARMMSLRWMSCDSPESGSIIPEAMAFGTETDLTGLTNYTQIPVVARYDDEDQGGVTALTDPQSIYTGNYYAFLPSNYPSWNGETNSEDKETTWYQTGTYWTTSNSVEANNFYAPSPYASDNTPNPLYRTTSYSGSSLDNSLSNFDGRHQTDAILAARGDKDYGTWKPTYNALADYPAASVCDMYHTVGTSQGDWYLPSMAELGYVVARLTDISNAVANVNGMRALSSYWLWSSSECDSSGARSLFTHNGSIGWTQKNSAFVAVVAFSMV